MPGEECLREALHVVGHVRAGEKVEVGGDGTGAFVEGDVEIVEFVLTEDRLAALLAVGTAEVDMPVRAADLTPAGRLDAVGEKTASMDSALPFWRNEPKFINDYMECIEERQWTSARAATDCREVEPRGSLVCQKTRHAISRRGTKLHASRYAVGLEIHPGHRAEPAITTVARCYRASASRYQGYPATVRLQDTSG